LVPSRKKRFSASDLDVPQDGMNAVDEGISRKSDKIAQKVLEIQQKLESALQADHGMPKWKADIEEEGVENAVVSHGGRRSSRSRVVGKPTIKKRARSNTTSSTQTAGISSPATQTDGTASPSTFGRGKSKALPEEIKTPTRGSFSDADRDERGTPGSIPSSSSEVSNDNDIRPAASPSPPTSALPSATSAGTTDDSDTDFQSAYSTSPRDSYGSFKEEPQPINFDEFGGHRERVSSVVRVINTDARADMSLPLSDRTVTTSS